jgi:cell division protein FtsQ
MISTKKLSARKSRIRGILKVVALLTVLVALLFHIRSKNFPIRLVKIFATYEHVERPQLQKIISPYLNKDFFHLNVFSIKHNLLEIPWIYDVSIKKRWPDTIVIHIVEQTAAMQWGENSLINSYGKIFTPPRRSFPSKLPHLMGPEYRALEIFRTCQQIIALLDPLDLAVEKLILTPHHHWELLLSSDTIIYLKEQQPIKQIELLTSLYRRITANHENPPKIIDLRYSNGLAVKW